MSRQSLPSEDDLTGGELPPGAVLGDPGSDAIIANAGDLDYTTERLQQRERDLLAEHEQNAKLLASLGSGAGLVGHGEAEDGAVVIETDSHNRITDLHLDPRALRLGSIDNLRKAILTAYGAAVTDVTDQLQEAGFGDVPPDMVRAMLDSMPELTAILPEASWSRFLDPDPSRSRDTEDEPSDPRSRRTPLDWEERSPYA